MIISAHAKINLGLLILNKRPDGYHNIATFFQEISLHDTLHIVKAGKGIKISCSDPDLPLDESNLVWQVFEQFRKAAGISGGIEIHIDKVIPQGGGLGGGSSDGAAVLRAANELWGTGLSREKLAEIGASVGSDVPFFIYGGSMLGEGRGEVLTAIPALANYYIVLICPGIHVSTAWAYSRSRIALTKEEKFTTFRALFPGLDPASFRANLVNEFEEIVFSEFPVLDTMKQQLYDSGAFYAGMSGSGSTMFGLFTGMKAAEKAGDLFSADGQRVHICRPFYRQNQVDQAGSIVF